MATFTVNAQRFDPYKNFKFRVKWDGRYVAGISKVGALKRTGAQVAVAVTGGNLNVGERFTVGRDENLRQRIAAALRFAQLARQPQHGVLQFPPARPAAAAVPRTGAGSNPCSPRFR